jgi:hypothetical protein
MEERKKELHQRVDSMNDWAVRLVLSFIKTLLS